MVEVKRGTRFPNEDNRLFEHIAKHTDVYTHYQNILEQYPELSKYSQRQIQSKLRATRYMLRKSMRLGRQDQEDNLQSTGVFEHFSVYGRLAVRSNLTNRSLNIIVDLSLCYLAFFFFFFAFDFVLLFVFFLIILF